MYRFIIAGIGVAVAALLALGCGGGGNDQATAQVTKAQFMKQARTICAKTQEEMEAAFVGKKELSSKNLDRIAAALKGEAEELDALSGPEETEARVEPLIKNISKVSGLVAREGLKGLNSQALADYKVEASDLYLGEC